MKTKLLYSILIVSFAANILSFGISQESYLPTSISITNSTKFDKELLLNLRASFANRKIKTISRDDAMELQKAEIERVLKPYYENIKKTGSNLNPEETRTYMSLNQHKVCNSLTLEINVTDDGIIKDTVKWQSRTLPFDFFDFKKEWHVMVLSAEQKTSILNITQTITDSIIASNVLAKQ